MKRLVQLLVVVAAANSVAMLANTGLLAWVALPKISFDLTERRHVDVASVAVVTPKDETKPMAFDVLPGKDAKENPDNGFSWIDVCDADVTDNDDPVSCARVGIKSERVELGSRSFNGSIPRDVVIVRNGKPVARFTESGLHVYGEITSDHPGAGLGRR